MAASSQELAVRYLRPGALGVDAGVHGDAEHRDGGHGRTRCAIRFGYRGRTGTGSPERAIFTGGGPWCSVRMQPNEHGHREVHERGPVRIWAQYERTHSEWEALGRPGWDRLGLTITSDGRHVVWLDGPDSAHTWRLPSPLTGAYRPVAYDDRGCPDSRTQIPRLARTDVPTRGGTVGRKALSATSDEETFGGPSIPRRAPCVGGSDTARAGEREVMAPRPRAALAMATTVAQRLLHPAAAERIRAAVDVDPTVVFDGFDGAAVRERLAEVDLLITGWGCAPLTENVLAAAPRLRAIVHTAGTVRHHVTEACWERGIAVSSAAAANAVPVAEYAVAMILLAGKRVPDIARRFRAERVQRDWNALHPEAGNYGATVGLLGASLVGRRVADLLRPFDLEVLLHDPYVSGAEVGALGAEPVGLDELFARSGVVSLHAPLLPATTGMVDARLLGLMRDGATLLNTARGGIVDHAALEREVLSGRLRAILDVTSPEPLPPDSPLWDCDGVVLTPHIAGSKSNELRRLADAATAEVQRWAAGLPFAHPVRRELLPLMA